MADVKEIVGRLAALTEELGREVDGALAASSAESRRRLEELSAETEVVRAERDEALAARQEAVRELDVAEKRIDSLVQKLKEARQAAVEAGEEAQRTLRRQLEALQGECDEARTELERERSVRKRLEKGAAADEKRLNEMEKALAAGKGAVGDGNDGKTFDKIRNELTEAREAAGRERRARERLETELAATGKKVAVLEERLNGAGSTAAAPVRVEALEEKLKLLEAQLVAEQQMCRRYAKENGEARRRITELESAASQAGSSASTGEQPPPAAARPAAEKTLPHELRPPPRPGALFHPHWELQSLPCASAEQVLQAWASVSNVQLSLEGYPSQYCSAYLAVVKQGRQKQLYLLFNLKELKHILVCVPTTPPKDEPSLGRLVEEGQKYLQMSGFDLEKLSSADIAKRLGHYLLPE